MPSEGSELQRMLRHLEIGSADGEVEVGLQTVIDSAGAFFPVSGAGLMLLGDDGLRASLATDEPGMALEDAEESIGQGPCVDALIYDRVVTTTDLADDERYTDLAPVVVPRGVRSVVGMPVHVGGSAVATINLYGDAPRGWSDDETRPLHAFAGVLGSMLSMSVLAHRQGVLVDQLQYALANRVTIERATGVIMARHDVDAVTAFNTLRVGARASRRKVAEIAAEVLSPGTAAS